MKAGFQVPFRISLQGIGAGVLVSVERKRVPNKIPLDV